MTRSFTDYFIDIIRVTMATWRCSVVAGVTGKQPLVSSFNNHRVAQRHPLGRKRGIHGPCTPRGSAMVTMAKKKGGPLVDTSFPDDDWLSEVLGVVETKPVASVREINAEIEYEKERVFLVSAERRGRTHSRTRAHTRAHTRVYIHTHTHIHSRTHALTHIHRCTHTSSG